MRRVIVSSLSLQLSPSSPPPQLHHHYHPPPSRHWSWPPHHTRRRRRSVVPVWERRLQGRAAVSFNAFSPVHDLPCAMPRNVPKSCSLREGVWAKGRGVRVGCFVSFRRTINLRSDVSSTRWEHGAKISNVAFLLSASTFSQPFTFKKYSTSKFLVHSLLHILNQCVIYSLISLCG